MSNVSVIGPLTNVSVELSTDPGDVSSTGYVTLSVVTSVEIASFDSIDESDITLEDTESYDNCGKDLSTLLDTMETLNCAEEVF